MFILLLPKNDRQFINISACIITFIFLLHLMIQQKMITFVEILCILNILDWQLFPPLVVIAIVTFVPDCTMEMFGRYRLHSATSMTQHKMLLSHQVLMREFWGGGGKRGGGWNK